MEAPLKKMMGLTNEMSFNPQNAAASPSSDYIFVDQLLNLSNEEEEEYGFVEEQEEEEETSKNKNSSVSAPLKINSNHSSTNSSEYEFWSVSSTDFEDLEWLSHLVADSSQQEYSAAAGAGVPCSVFLTEKPKPTNYQNETTHLKFGSNLKTPFPSKPRSKRERARISGRRVWSSMNSISSPAKKPKRNSAVEGSGRRCSHCGVQKTPQWRAGPLGAKTLCNACGVRFKSGRLFPEYRPACSPSFSSEIHSNHHRKVLEMRRKQESGSNPTPE